MVTGCWSVSIQITNTIIFQKLSQLSIAFYYLTAYNSIAQSSGYVIFLVSIGLSSQKDEEIISVSFTLLENTDDLLQASVSIVAGCYSVIKVTTEGNYLTLSSCTQVHFVLLCRCRGESRAWCECRSPRHGWNYGKFVLKKFLKIAKNIILYSPDIICRSCLKFKRHSGKYLSVSLSYVRFLANHIPNISDLCQNLHLSNFENQSHSSH